VGKLAQRCQESQVATAFAKAFLSRQNEDERSLIAEWGTQQCGNDMYKEYLASLATIAVTSDAPTTFVEGPNGTPIRGKLNPEFEQWCRLRNLNPEHETGVELYINPHRVGQLAAVNDEKLTTPIFLKGLTSKNVLVVAKSASGLAKSGKREYILPILSAASASAPYIDGLISATLTRFPDSEEYIRLELRGSRLLPTYERSLRYKRQEKKPPQNLK